MDDPEMIDCPEDAKQLERLRAIVHRLRAPGGCPWDAEQTHRSLVPNLIEEAYETADTIRRDDRPHLCEELGDLLLQVFLHSEIAEQDGAFRIEDVARAISDKLVRRHPHVFGSSAAGSSAAVLKQWEEIKRDEKGHRDEPYLHHVGHGLPALLRATKLQKKAAKVGFDWPTQLGVLGKIREELLELQAAVDEPDPEAIDEELGDLLFAVVNLARHSGSDPELLLDAANRKFEQRFAAMEQLLHQRRLTLEEASLDQMEDAWQTTKSSPSS
jgi:MazG family protein